MRSSPCIRGAPQAGFCTTMWKIKSRTSFDVGLLPTCVMAREISRQYKRKPARCQRTTASGVTTISDCFHPDQNRRTATQKILSSGPILGLGCRRLSTASCWRKARFSRKRLRRARKRRTSVPRRTAIIRIMASSYNRTAREGDSHVIDFPDGRNFGGRTCSPCEVSITSRLFSV